jgi:hypothetical protein
VVGGAALEYPLVGAYAVRLSAPAIPASLMPGEGVGAGVRVFYSHAAPLVTAPKLDTPWRPRPLPPVGVADLQRVLDGLKKLN